MDQFEFDAEIRTVDGEPMMPVRRASALIRHMAMTVTNTTFGAPPDDVPVSWDNVVTMMRELSVGYAQILSDAADGLDADAEEVGDGR